MFSGTATDLCIDDGSRSKWLGWHRFQPAMGTTTLDAEIFHGQTSQVTAVDDPLWRTVGHPSGVPDAGLCPDLLRTPAPVCTISGVLNGAHTHFFCRMEISHVR